MTLLPFHECFSQLMLTPVVAQSVRAQAVASWVTARSDTLVSVLLVGMAITAGLAAAFGRELQAGRHPDGRWWLARFLLLPMLSIGATAASDAFSLSRSMTAFTAAMLSLGGYDCLRLIEAHFRARIFRAATANDELGPRSSDDEHE